MAHKKVKAKVLFNLFLFLVFGMDFKFNTHIPTIE